MKNSTGKAIMWQGQVYPPGEDVPDAIAKKMNLSAMNKEAEKSNPVTLDMNLLETDGGGGE